MTEKQIHFATVLFVILLAPLCVLSNRPPAPAAADSPANQFSAERAMTHEFAIAQKPHPLGSPEHDRVRDYIVAELSRLGLSPQIQKATGVTKTYQAAGSVENILARLPGTSGRADALLLAAHYDSVAAGPGAADDAAGVAALLETLRALRASPPPANDIIFLITDGEEDGLLGASAFLAAHPWARDVRLAVNFEARGNAGPSQMFETSPANGLRVSALAHSVPHPAGSSLTYEIYKRMPNDTDMTQFKKNGIAVLNFAFIGHWEAYHTPLDSPQNLNRGSLQQHGEAALALARHFGAADLSHLQSPDAVYFSVLGRIFFFYSIRWIWPLAGISAGLFLAVALFAGGAGEASLTGIAKAFGACLAGLVLLPVCGWVFERILTALHARALSDGNLAQNSFYLLSLCALLLAAWTFAYRALRKTWTAGNLILGAALTLLLLSIPAARWLPGGSYVFQWPLLALLLAGFFVCGRQQGSASHSHGIALAALSIPAILLFVPLVGGFYEALGLSALGAAGIALALAILFLSLTPILESSSSSRSAILPFGALAAALLLFLVGAKTSAYSAAHPKPSLLAYALDADSSKAIWASSAGRLDPWTAQFLGDNPARAKLAGFYPGWLPFRFLQHEAPPLALRPAQAKLVESVPSPNARSLVLRISSPRGARALLLSAPENDIQESWVNGVPLGQPGEARWNSTGKWSLSYVNPGPEGIELKLSMKGSAPLRLVVVERSTGLPEIPGKPLPPRPPDSMSHHSGDETLVRRAFVF